MNKLFRPFIGSLIALLAALLLGSGALALASDDDSDHKPSAQTGPATAVADRSATLTAQVEPKGSTTTFRFEYGPTTSYGQSSAEGTLVVPGSTEERPVSAAVSGLSPSTRYHFRVRATNANGTDTGSDRSFTTLAATAAPSGTPATTDGSVAPSLEAPAPRLGTSLLVAPLQGTIRVKSPGASGFTTLAARDSVPVGSLVDSRHGTVKLTSSLGAAATQSGEFHGGLFQVRQAVAGHGMTDLVLRGEDFASCSRAAGHSARSSASTRGRKRPARHLWGHDKGGRFKTHGQNSVATVRGTTWLTTDTCAGTRTTVKQGAVSVRDRRRGKAVLVRAGHSYLARSAR